MDLNEINQIKTRFKKMTDLGTEKGFYLDINYFEKLENRINIDKENTNIDKSNDCGIKIRVFDGEKFLERAQSRFDEKSLKESCEKLILKAEKNIFSLKKKIHLQIDETKLNENFFPKENEKIKKANESLDLKSKCEKLKGYLSRIQDFNEVVVNSRVALIEEREIHIFVNPFKELYQEIPLNIFVMLAYINCEDGNTRSTYKSLVSENLDVFEKADLNFEEFSQMILNMNKAKKLKGGKYKAILTPTISGLLAHESFGHGMEADTMMKGRALASDYLGEKIGDEKISIVDYPKIEGKHGNFHFDHEGNIAKKTYLVKNGIINEPMADLYSKTKLNLKNCVNSRFETFDHKNYVRMSNTYFEPGNEEFKDLLKRVNEGILIISSSGGMEDPKGWGVQIQGCFGQKIEAGELVDEFFDGFSFTGFLPEIIKSISGISKDFEIEGGGHCGKGHKEWVRVSEGGPYLLTNEVILG